MLEELVDRHLEDMTLNAAGFKGLQGGQGRLTIVETRENDAMVVAGTMREYSEGSDEIEAAL